MLVQELKYQDNEFGAFYSVVTNNFYCSYIFVLLQLAKQNEKNSAQHLLDPSHSVFGKQINSGIYKNQLEIVFEILLLPLHAPCPEILCSVFRVGHRHFPLQAKFLNNPLNHAEYNILLFTLG
jgi:hypothetical protein